MGMLSTIRKAAKLVRLAKLIMKTIEVGATVADRLDEAVEGVKAGWANEELPSDEEREAEGRKPLPATMRTAAQYAQAARRLVDLARKFLQHREKHTESVEEVSQSAASEPEDEPEQMTIFQLIQGGAET